MDGTDALRGGLTTLRAAFATPDLRRAQIAWVTTALGNWAFFVLLAVYAYNHGGAAAVGLAALARMLPAGLTAPFTSLLADRRSRRDVLLLAAIARALALALIVVAVAAGAPFGIVLALAAAQTVAATAAKPAQAALLPLLSRTPEQLAAANVTWNVIENVGFLAGSLLGGALAAGAGVSAGFAATAVAFAVSAALVLRLPRDVPPPHREARAGEQMSTEVLAGFHAVLGDPHLRLVVGTLAATTLVEGAADVLMVVVAFDALGIGDAGVGWLNAAWAVGGILGGALTVAMLGGGRLASGLGAGTMLVGAALAGLAAWPALVPALLLLALIGFGYALVEVAGLTLTQRLASDDVLGRVFGVVESSYVITTALGSALAGAAVGLFGLDATLVATGAVTLLLTLAVGRPLARLEASVPIPEREFGLLRGLGVFAPLPIATLETLAARLRPTIVTPGEVIVQEGDAGDRCYVVAEGAVELSKRDGWTMLLERGALFGELALLRDAPRNATAVATREGLLLALERADFLSAVTGHARTRDAADALVRERGGPHHMLPSVISQDSAKH